MIERRRSEVTDDQYFSVKGEKGIGKFINRIWIPNVMELKHDILSEAHESRYSIHSGSTKIYQDCKRNYWWPNRKSEMAEWVSKCLIYQKVKAKHRPSMLLQPLEIPE